MITLTTATAASSFRSDRFEGGVLLASYLETVVSRRKKRTHLVLKDATIAASYSRQIET